VTLADRLAVEFVQHGPMAECHLATTVRKRKDDVSAALEANPDRFVHNGRKARASRWDVREVVDSPSRPPELDEVTWPAGFERGEEALVTLIRQGRRSPEDAVLLLISAWAAA
jgi:hypothetical protein